jgi:hypothetical protein
VERLVLLISLGSALLLGSATVTAAGDPGTDSGSMDAAVATPIRALPGQHPFGMALALDTAGHRHLVASDLQGDLWYATDGGGSWQAEEVLRARWDADAGWPLWVWTSPAIAIDADGSVHVAAVRSSVMDTPGTSYGIYYITDQGRSTGNFGPRTKITGDGMASPSLRVVDGVRYLAFTRYLTYPGQKRVQLYFKTDRSGSWQTERIDDVAYAPSMRVASDGRAHIAYEDEKGLRYTRARTRTGGFTAPARIPGSKGKAGDVSLALDRADRPHVAWAAWRQSKQVLYAKRTGAGWVVPRQVGTGWTAKLSLDAKDRPHVAFARGFGNSKVVHRWRAGGTWQLRTVVSGVDVGGVDIRAFGNGATIAWSQSSKPRGVWVVPD